MKFDITTEQALLLVALLDERIPYCSPEAESLFMSAKKAILAALVGEICDKNQPQ